MALLETCCVLLAPNWPLLSVLLLTSTCQPGIFFTKGLRRVFHREYFKATDIPGKISQVIEVCIRLYRSDFFFGDTSFKGFKTICQWLTSNVNPPDLCLLSS
jgi:hypothetical protein